MRGAKKAAKQEVQPLLGTLDNDDEGGSDATVVMEVDEEAAQIVSSEGDIDDLDPELQQMPSPESQASPSYSFGEEYEEIDADGVKEKDLQKDYEKLCISEEEQVAMAKRKSIGHEDDTDLGTDHHTTASSDGIPHFMVLTIGQVPPKKRKRINGFGSSFF